ncbi:hypothetical protein CR513_24871, partial [Mucuna pruriens]
MEEYYQDMEVALLRASVLKSNEETMTHFLHRLNRDIQDIVELYHYTSMDDLVHQTTRRSYPNSPKRWKSKDEEKKQPRKDKSPKKGSFLPQSQKEEKILSIPILVSKSNSIIKCFKCLGKGHIASQCPNKRSMILKEDEIVDYKSFQDESSSISETSSFISNFSPDDNDLLMVRCLMSACVGKDDDSQRENIFHSRCHILGKLCSIIIDGGSCVNIASLRLVEKLNLYTLVSVAFTLGKYSDEVLCDVVPMEATHILLG